MTTLAEAMKIISSVNFSEEKPKQFEGIAGFLRQATDEITVREQKVTARERDVSEREAQATMREDEVEARERTLTAVEVIKPKLSFWRGGFSHENRT